MEQQVTIHASLADLRQMIEDVVEVAMQRNATQQAPKYVKGVKGAAEFLGVSTRTIERNAPKDAKVRFGSSTYYDTTKLLSNGKRN